jgi:hypothetical protein
MHTHHFGHPDAAGNGRPQTVAVFFCGLIFIMLLIPVATVSVEGASDSRLLLYLLKSDAGFNIFALLLFLAPIVGVAVAMWSDSAWRIATTIVAIVAIIMIPLTLITFSHEANGIANGLASTSPSVGSYVLLFGYLLIALITGTAAIRARHS